MTLGNPADQPVVISAYLTIDESDPVCMSGACGGTPFFTGIIGPGDERQVMFSFIMVNIPYDTEVEYEVAVVASAPVTCVNASYFSTEHSNLMKVKEKK